MLRLLLRKECMGFVLARDLNKPRIRELCGICADTFTPIQTMNEAYEVTKGGQWTRHRHRCGIWLEKRPIGVGLAKKLLAQFRPKKQLPRCGELIILSERTDAWHVELVNTSQYLHLQRWET